MVEFTKAQPPAQQIVTAVEAVTEHGTSGVREWKCFPIAGGPEWAVHCLLGLGYDGANQFFQDLRYDSQESALKGILDWEAQQDWGGEGRAESLDNSTIIEMITVLKDGIDGYDERREGFFNALGQIHSLLANHFYRDVDRILQAAEMLEDAPVAFSVLLLAITLSSKGSLRYRKAFYHAAWHSLQQVTKDGELVEMLFAPLE